MPRKQKDTFQFNKPWYNFLDKLDKYKTLPLSEWKVHQLLGYVLDKNNMFISPVYKMNQNENITNSFSFARETWPTKHPLFRIIENVYKRYKDPIETKEFLDFCMTDINKKITRFDIFKEVKRYTPTPNSLKELFPTISTYGDLSLLIQFNPEKVELLNYETQQIIKKIK